MFSNSKLKKKKNYGRIPIQSSFFQFKKWADKLGWFISSVLVPESEC
jgi:hypothetical protein